MAINILHQPTLDEVNIAPNQEDQLIALLDQWLGSDVTVRIMSGSTLLSTLTCGAWTVAPSTPRTAVLGTRKARTFVAIGTPTKLVFRAGSTDVFEITAGVGSGDVQFAASIISPALERVDGVAITATSSLPVSPVLNLSSNAPNRVVIEDWSSGSAVDVGTITLDTLIRADRFADPRLAADCKGWLEYGPASAVGLPVLDGVQFSAKGFDIRSGGIYSQRSFRVLVMMRAVGTGTFGQSLVDGLFGDPRGVNHYPRPHKVRIVSVAGTVLKTIEMRDGLPMNDLSLVNIPLTWTVTSRPSDGSWPNIDGFANNLPNNKPMRPAVAAGACYIAAFGDENPSSVATRNRIPRAKIDLWPSANSKIRGIYNGEDFHLADKMGVNGNGNAHPEVMPRWSLSYDQAVAVTNVAPGDPDIYSPGGGNWYNALHVGWGYEPGALGGITRRGGPGGVRMDRTALPNEIYQMALTSATRLSDGASTEEMARNFAFNCANYPIHYPRSMTTLDAMNVYSTDPQPTVPGRDIWPVQHYYGGPVTGAPGEIQIFDTYGNGHGPISQAVEASMPGVGLNRTTARGHVRNGWSPDTEHNNRGGAAYAALFYSDPIFTRMHEFIMLESSMSPLVARGTWGIYGEVTMNPGPTWEYKDVWNSRSNVLPFIHAVLMWWTASNNGVYTRPQVEERLKAFFTKWKVFALDNPAVADSPSMRSINLTGGLGVRWTTWTTQYNLTTDSGWVADYGLYSLYMMNFFILLKSSGLYDVLMQDPACNQSLTGLLKIHELNARMFAACPWATCNDGPSLLLRSASQGAVQSDWNTVPTTIGQVVAFNPAIRGDQYWFLNSTAVPGTSSVSYLPGNYAGYSRMGCARSWWELFAPVGAERTAALAAIDAHITTLKNYTPRLNDSAFNRFNFAQIVPALVE